MSVVATLFAVNNLFDRESRKTGVVPIFDLLWLFYATRFLLDISQIQFLCTCWNALKWIIAKLFPAKSAQVNRKGAWLFLPSVFNAFSSIFVHWKATEFYTWKVLSVLVFKAYWESQDCVTLEISIPPVSK